MAAAETVAPPLRLNLLFQPKQMSLLEAILDQRPTAPSVLGFGGARGGSKSGGVRRCAVAVASGFPGVIVWIIRRVWDDLNKNHVLKMWEDFPELQQYYHAQDRRITLPNKSTIFFIHAGDPGRAKRKSRGPEAHYIFVDQAEEFSQAELEQLEGSNRGAGAAKGVCKRIYTFNPGGIGTQYLRRIFHLKEIHGNERPGDFWFQQAFGWDNFEWFRGLNLVAEWDFYHDPAWNQDERFSYQGHEIVTCRRRFEVFVNQTDFGDKLRKLPEAQRIGELFGDFESFAGQYYADVWEPKSIVLPPACVAKIIKPWWPRWIALDWGFSHYAAAGWATSGLLTPQEILEWFGIEAAGPVRALIVYREAVVCDTPEPALARLILAMTPDSERREIRYAFAGHDCWAVRGSANTVVDQMDPVLSEGGITRLQRADIDRPGGWRLLYNCFASARRLRTWTGPGPFEDRLEDPPALFIAAQCTEIQSAVPTLISDYDAITNPNGNPQDVRKMAGQAGDDVADMLRYLVKSYLRAEPGIPASVTAAQTWQAYQDPTARAMAMLRMEAKQAEGQRIQRRRRL
jgi:hypothetical protein